MGVEGLIMGREEGRMELSFVQPFLCKGAAASTAASTTASTPASTTASTTASTAANVDAVEGHLPVNLPPLRLKLRLRRVLHALLIAQEPKEAGLGHHLRARHDASMAVTAHFERRHGARIPVDVRTPW